MEKIYALLLLLIVSAYILVTLLPIIANNFVVTYGDGFVYIERHLNFKERLLVLQVLSLCLIIITGTLIHLYYKIVKKRQLG